MALEIYLDHDKDEVSQAIVQFTARRSYRLRQPWYLDGMRIEAPAQNHTAAFNFSHDGSVKNKPTAADNLFSIFGRDVPRIDIILRRRRGRTRLRISVGPGPTSTQLAYELHNYLQDNRAYDCQCPSMCPRCGSPVCNVTACYCGRCGQKLVASVLENEPSQAVKVEPRRKSSLRREVTLPLPPVPISVDNRKERETSTAQAISPAEIEVIPTESPPAVEVEDESTTINPPAEREVESISDSVNESAEEPPDSTDACSPVEEQTKRRAIAED